MKVDKTNSRGTCCQSKSTTQDFSLVKKQNNTPDIKKVKLYLLKMMKEDWDQNLQTCYFTEIVGAVSYLCKFFSCSWKPGAFTILKNSGLLHHLTGNHVTIEPPGNHILHLAALLFSAFPMEQMLILTFFRSNVSIFHFSCKERLFALITSAFDRASRYSEYFLHFN